MDFLRSQTVPEPFVISTEGALHPKEVSVHVSWFSRKRDENGDLRFEEHRPDEPEGAASIVIATHGETRIHEIENLRAGFSLRVSGLHRSGIGCFFVGANTGESTADLGTLWDGIALSDNEQDVVEALRIIDPHISKVTMVWWRGTSYAAYCVRTGRKHTASRSAATLRRRDESVVRDDSFTCQWPAVS